MEEGNQRRRNTGAVFQDVRDVTVNGGSVNVAGGDIITTTHNYHQPVHNNPPVTYNSFGLGHNTISTAHNVNTGHNEGEVYMNCTTGVQAPHAPPPPSHPSDYFSATPQNPPPSYPTQSTFSPSPTVYSPSTTASAAPNTPYTTSAASTSSAAQTPQEYRSETPEVEEGDNSPHAEPIGFFDAALAMAGLARMARVQAESKRKR